MMQKWLPMFVVAARRQDGKDYPARTLYCLMCAIRRKLQDRGVLLDFFDEKELELRPIRDALDARMKEVTAANVGVHVKHSEPISPAQEQILWDKGVLGTHDALSLQNTVFFYVAKIFALRGGQEHRKLSVSDFEFLTVDEGRAVRFRGGKCKNFSGGLKDLKKEPKSVLHISPFGSDPCIVHILETYIKAIGNEDPFYRKSLPSKPKEPYRFSKQAIGHNMLAQKMKSICQAAGLEGNFTNHSGRHTTGTQLHNEGNLLQSSCVAFVVEFFTRGGVKTR